MTSKITVPFTIEWDNDDTVACALDVKVTCEVDGPYHAFSDDRGGFGPVVTDVDVISAVDDRGVDCTMFVVDWLDASDGRMDSLRESVFEQAQHDDEAAQEAACEWAAERRVGR